MLTGIIDLHHDDGAIDVPAMRRGGAVAIIHKVSEGRDWVDPDAQSVLKAARTAGMLTGAYHYANGTDPITQADHFLARAALAAPEALLALDCEDNRRSRFGTMSALGAAAFVKRVHEKTGRWPVFYSFTSFIRGMAFDTAARDVLSRCPLWQAQYGERPRAPASSVWKRIDLWQYTNGADGPADQRTFPRVTPGCARPAQDRSAFDGDEAALRAWWQSAGRTA